MSEEEKFGFHTFSEGWNNGIELPNIEPKEFEARFRWHREQFLRELNKLTKMSKIERWIYYRRNRLVYVAKNFPIVIDYYHQWLKIKLKRKPNKDEYRCAICEKIYKYGRSDEEAIAEAKANWGENVMNTPCDVICDDCYNDHIKPIFQ